MPCWNGSPSQVSTPADTFQLTLVTLAGEEIQLPIDLREHDRLDELEDAVVECLLALDFVHPSTQKLLKDPIWDTLSDCTRFNLVVRNCFVSIEHKRQLQKGYPRAIQIPAADTGSVLDNAFYSVPRLRRVLGETGIHTIGAAVWQRCQKLQLVKLPTTVVCIKLKVPSKVAMH